MFQKMISWKAEKKGVKLLVIWIIWRWDRGFDCDCSFQKFTRLFVVLVMFELACLWY
jgi:hypothetical protein